MAKVASLQGVKGDRGKIGKPGLKGEPVSKCCNAF